MALFAVLLLTCVTLGAMSQDLSPTGAVTKLDITGEQGETISFPMQLSITLGDENGNGPQGNGGNFKNIFDQCKYLVGSSQIFFCRLNPVTKSSEVNVTYPKSCREILEAGNTKSGVYEIKPLLSNKPFAVLCDMETRGGGWTHIQKRFDGSQNFYLPWIDYKFGFGDLEREFWMGLENIYHMTASETSELLIEVTDTNNRIGYAQYTSFVIGPERNGYTLTELNGFSGDAGDSLSFHVGARFSTLDVDQDTKPNKSCAKEYESAWWFVSCLDSNLNGKYMNIVFDDKSHPLGLIWPSFTDSTANLAGSRMMIRAPTTRTT
ncbi:microfibril-associated glycoprotein 4-like isoform X2 [Diabrotica undecimpunctata]|uniref:microfibril-associated glycoprotein 4-like isoform X2 n=1 Tax=Diabrotica undecimpunctata TaxID=50387 RepID=UPI003B63D447